MDVAECDHANAGVAGHANAAVVGCDNANVGVVIY